MGSGASSAVNSSASTVLNGNSATSPASGSQTTTNPNNFNDVHPSKIISLSLMSKFLRVFRNNETGEALVLIDQDIDSSNIEGSWMEVRLSRKQAAYFDSLDIGIKLSSSDAETKSPKNDSVAKKVGKELPNISNFFTTSNATVPSINDKKKALNKNTNQILEPLNLRAKLGNIEEEATLSHSKSTPNTRINTYQKYLLPNIETSTSSSSVNSGYTTSASDVSSSVSSINPYSGYINNGERRSYFQQSSEEPRDDKFRSQSLNLPSNSNKHIENITSSSGSHHDFAFWKSQHYDFIPSSSTNSSPNNNNDNNNNSNNNDNIENLRNTNSNLSSTTTVASGQQAAYSLQNKSNLFNSDAANIENQTSGNNAVNNSFQQGTLICKLCRKSFDGNVSFSDLEMHTTKCSAFKTKKVELDAINKQIRPILTQLSESNHDSMKSIILKAVSTFEKKMMLNQIVLQLIRRIYDISFDDVHNSDLILIQEELLGIHGLVQNRFQAMQSEKSSKQKHIISSSLKKTGRNLNSANNFIDPSGTAAMLVATNGERFGDVEIKMNINPCASEEIELNNDHKNSNINLDGESVIVTESSTNADRIKINASNISNVVESNIVNQNNDEPTENIFEKDNNNSTVSISANITLTRYMSYAIVAEVDELLSENDYDRTISYLFEYLTQAVTYLSKKRAVLGEYSELSDLSFVDLLHEGEFSSVYLAQRNNDQKLYAIKVIKKLEKSKESVENELKIMIRASKYPHYFIRLRNTFQTINNVFIVTDYEPIGDCLNMLSRMNRTMSEDCAKGFIAEVCSIIAHLHDRDIIHRDVKLDNILVTLRGHAKLMDFGVSTIIPRNRTNASSATPSLNSNSVSASGSHPHSASASNFNSASVSTSGKSLWLENASSSDKQSSLTNNTSYSDQSTVDFRLPGLLRTPVGNKYYAAPEILVGLGYDHAVDWWAVGILTFHSMAGLTPFEGDYTNEIDLHDRIAKGNISWDRLPSISTVCMNFIESLLIQEPRKRLGMNISTALISSTAMNTSIKDVFNHPWIRDLSSGEMLFNTEKGPLFELAEEYKSKVINKQTTAVSATKSKAEAEFNKLIRSSVRSKVEDDPSANKLQEDTQYSACSFKDY